MRFGKKNGATANDPAGAPQTNQGSTDPNDGAIDGAGDNLSSEPETTEKSDPPAEPEPSSEPEKAEPESSSESACVPLKAPGDASSCTLDGREYSIVDGRILVEERHVAHLLEIGFTFIPA